jgi:RHS repeat-associated protein
VPIGPAGSTTATTITESTYGSLARSGSEAPLECLFAPNGQVRAALYLAHSGEPSQVKVFRPGAEFGSAWAAQSADRVPISGSSFRDLDAATMARIETAAGIPGHPTEPVPAKRVEPQPSPGPDAALLRLASYNPTTPTTQGSATSLRVTTRTYDKLDRLETETVQLEDGSTATLSYTYWKNSLRKTLTDAVGRVTFYEYNGLNLLSRLTVNQGLPDEQVTTYDYWGDGLLKTVVKPDGTVTSYDYDGGDRLKSVLVRKGGTALLSYAYTYDGNGNRKTQVEVNGGSPETTTYTYDALNRLETVTYADGRNVAYGYDLVGNRTSETEQDPTGVVVSHKTAVFDSVNRLSTVTDPVNPANNATFGYDRNGNLTTKTTAAGVATYVYDAHDQLAETRQGSQITARFAYDAFGRRYLKIGDEGIRQYLYDQTSLLEEFTDHNVEVAKYEWGGDRLVSLFRQDAPRRYFHLDGLGSVALLTEDSGSAAARYHYDAWGRHRDLAELDASANRFGFTGHYFDTETKLYFAKARYYDPDFGRFLTQDDYLGQLDNPPSLHRYFYANDNPTRYIDLSGHAPEDPQPVSAETLKKWEQYDKEHPADQGLPRAVTITEPRTQTCSGVLCPVAEPLLEGGSWVLDNTLGRFTRWSDKKGAEVGAKVREHIVSQEPSEHLLSGRRQMTEGLPAEVLAVDQGTQQLGTRLRETAGDLAEEGTRAVVREGAVGIATMGASRVLTKVAEAAEGVNATGGITRLERRGFVKYEGFEVRGVRDLSHVPESTLRAMEEQGFAARDATGKKLILHHLDQNPAGPLVEMPGSSHSIGNRIQHPLGNASGAGLSAEQRQAFDAWRENYWRARAAEELVRRGLK